jgi:SOS response regulatory protein OraA/RecX
MRQALRENDSRIQEAAMAVMSGEGSERVRIQKEIIAEGHFKQDYVIEATNAEIQYVRTKIKEANEFIRKGKDSEADKIYESLLARGYSEEFLDKLIK